MTGLSPASSGRRFDSALATGEVLWKIPHDSRS